MKQKPLFQKFREHYFASVTCPDCRITHLVSHKNYYAQKAGKRNLSFRCQKCGHARAARIRRNPKLRKLTSHGYIKVYHPENPMADKNGEIYEHRLIMSQTLNRPLKRHEHIHHLNGNRADNRPENLELVSSQQNTVLKDMRKHIIRLENLLREHHIAF